MTALLVDTHKYLCVCLCGCVSDNIFESHICQIFVRIKSGYVYESV